MNLKDFKYSYNRYYKIYRLQIKENGKWRKCTYDRKTLKFTLSNNLTQKDEIRNFSFKPYFLYIIKWRLMSVWKWLKRKDTPIRRFLNSGWGLLIIAILGFLYFLLPYLKSINESNKYQNNKQDVPPTTEQLHNEEESKENEEESVLINDSLTKQVDSLAPKQ